MVAALLKVRAHPVLEDDGLADVDDLAGGVLHNINARLFWQGLEDTLNVFRDFDHTGYFNISSMGKELSTNYTDQVFFVNLDKYHVF